MWPDRRLSDPFAIRHPIIQAPMAGPCYADMAIAVTQAGGLGSLPTATFTPEEARAELQLIRQQTAGPLNLNFFCHQPPVPDDAREAKWRQRLKPYYGDFGSLWAGQAASLGRDMPAGELTRLLAGKAQELMSRK